MQHVCVVLNLETSHSSYLCTKLFRQLYEFSFEAQRIGAIENVNTIDESRSKIVSKKCFDCHLSPPLFLAIFDPYSSVVKSVFDCRLFGVHISKVNSMSKQIWKYKQRQGGFACELPHRLIEHVHLQ